MGALAPTDIGLFERLISTREIIKRAFSVARFWNDDEVTTGHLLWAIRNLWTCRASVVLSDENIGTKTVSQKSILNAMKKFEEPKNFSDNLNFPVSDEFQKMCCIIRQMIASNPKELDKVDSVFLLLAMIETPDSEAVRLLKCIGVNISAIKKNLRVWLCLDIV